MVVILSSKLWCTFKEDKMSTFEKLCKADHILAWLGKDRYSEVKPLHIKTGSGNIAEWQLLAEYVDHMHDRSTSVQTQRRPSKATASISLKKKDYLQMYDEPVSPPRTRKGTKRDSKVKIDYKQFHNEGTTANKQKGKERILPKADGHSESCLASQQMIRIQKRSYPTPPENKSTILTKRQKPTVLSPENKRRVAATGTSACYQKGTKPCATWDQTG